MNLEFSIYALVDPREPLVIRYVGATSNSTVERLRQHIYSVKHGMKSIKITKVQRWIVKLLKAGFSPSIITLQECNAEQVSDLETKLISKYAKTGKLKNCLKNRPYPICNTVHLTMKDFKP